MSDTDPAISDLESGKLVQKIEENSKDIQALTEVVSRLAILLRGNGPVGLVTRMDRIERNFLILGFIIIPAISSVVAWAVGRIFK